MAAGGTRRGRPARDATDARRRGGTTRRAKRRRTARRRPAARAVGPLRPAGRLRGAALEVGDLGVLALGALLGARALLLRVGLALLEDALPVGVRVAGEIAGGLLDPSADLVCDSHAVVVPVGAEGQAAAPRTSSTVIASRPGSGSPLCGSPRP